jgi:hypothetical protein
VSEPDHRRPRLVPAAYAALGEDITLLIDD